jgi:hypothetical protein
MSVAVAAMRKSVTFGALRRHMHCTRLIPRAIESKDWRIVRAFPALEPLRWHQGTLRKVG